MDEQNYVINKVTQVQDEALIKSWLHGKSKKTIQVYNRIAEDLLANLHPRSLKHADLQFLQNFINLLKARKPETIKQRIAATRSLFCPQVWVPPHKSSRFSASS